MGIGENLRAFRRISSASPRSGTLISLYNTCREKEKTRYTARLAQSENYGIAFGLASALQEADHAVVLRDTDHALVGEDSREILKDRRYRDDMDRTALIDLVMGHVSAAANDQVILDQILRDKYAHKSRLFADEAEVYCGGRAWMRLRGANLTSSS